MNDSTISVPGNVVTEPIQRMGRNGPFTTFRIANTPFRRTPDGKFVDGETNYYSVIAFGALGGNLSSSLRKGQPVHVEGVLTTRTYVTAEGVERQSNEVLARRVGHDLAAGRASFVRVSRAEALGLDPTGAPEVRDAFETMAREQDQELFEREQGRPANVDANGEIHDDPAELETVSEDGGAGLGLGDPNEVEYRVEQPAA